MFTLEKDQKGRYYIRPYLTSAHNFYTFIDSDFEFRCKDLIFLLNPKNSKRDCLNYIKKAYPKLENDPCSVWWLLKNNSQRFLSLDFAKWFGVCRLFLSEDLGFSSSVVTNLLESCFLSVEGSLYTNGFLSKSELKELGF